MPIDKILSQIRQKIAPCYFIVDKTYFFSDLMMSEIRKNYLEKRTSDNFKIVDKDDENIDVILEDLNTISLFSPKKMIVFRNADRLKKEDCLKFTDFLKSSPEQCCLLFSAEKTPKHELYQFCKSKQYDFSFKQPYESQMIQWIQWMAHREKKTIDSQTGYLLLSKVGQDLLRLKMEMEKIAIAVGEKASIEDDDIHKILFSSRPHSIFELLSAIGLKKKAKALSIVTQMMAEGESEVFIFSMIFRHIKNLWRAVAWQPEKSDGEVQRLLGIHPYFWNEFQKQRDAYVKTSFQNIWKWFLDTETILKTMNIDKRNGIIALVYRLCH